MSANSRRRFEKATYTPLRTRGPDDPPREGDAFGRAALVRSLEVTPTELSAIAAQVDDPEMKSAVEAIAAAANATSGDAVLRAAAALRQVSRDVLARFGQLLRDVRRRAVADAASAVATLEAKFATVQAAPALPAAPAAQLVAPATSAPATGGDPATDGPLAPFATSTAVVSARPRTEVVAGPFEATKTTIATARADRLRAAIAWARDNDGASIAELARTFSAFGSASISEPLAVLEDEGRRDRLIDLFTDALTRRPLEPLGVLHLERLEMLPVEIERGELVYSLPLAPLEKVTLAHRVWATREEEYAEYIQDYLENFSEKGVAQSEDIGMASETQTAHSNAITVTQSSAAAGVVSLTPPADSTSPSSVVEDETSKRESKDQARAITERASARTVKDHKVSFTVTTVSGMEDFTARVLENKHTDRSMQIDYYRRMRRWETTLYRYGARLTYDVVLPDPGQRLRARILELRSLDDQIAQDFDFPVQPGEITRYNYLWYASRYSVDLPVPPDGDRVVQRTAELDYPPSRQIPPSNASNPSEIARLELPVPDGYVARIAYASVNAAVWNNAQTKWAWVFIANQWQSLAIGNGVSGTVQFDLGTTQGGTVIADLFSAGLATGRFDVTLECQPSDGAMMEWSMRAWRTLRDAAYNSYLRNRDVLRERRSALQRQLAADDTVSLRRKEREQIMRAVLSWLFPGFDDASSVLENLPSPGQLDLASWQKIMEYGEYIKFVHAAIDWDNVVVLLYPYFWDAKSHEDEKLFLDHDDAAHREFLRAGAARIILAIRPGFEEQVVTLLDEGQLGATISDARFRKVAHDVQEANRKYALASTQSEDPVTPGVRIGHWHDHTPLGALDIDVSTKPVANLA